MNRHRAVVIGCGRMGVGWGVDLPYIYDHASAYLALKERVELVALVEPNIDRAVKSERRLGVISYSDIRTMIREEEPDIVSICTPQELHCRNLVEALHEGIKGFWIEKPMEIQPEPEGWPSVLPPTQVNYCRRACQVHRQVRKIINGMTAHLFVWAKKDWTTIVHFADLARWMGIPKERIHYQDNIGEFPATNSYRIEAGKWAFDFRNGGCKRGFMETMLGNLLDVLDGRTTKLISPASSAIESEKLAKELMNA